MRLLKHVNFFSKIKMTYYFPKCCFEAEVIGKRAKCDRLSSDKKHTEFTLFYHKINKEYFLLLK